MCSLLTFPIEGSVYDLIGARNHCFFRYSAYMSDVWAASVCLWIFIFGKLPFYHPDVVKLFTMIRYVYFPCCE